MSNAKSGCTQASLFSAVSSLSNQIKPDPNEMTTTYMQILMEVWWFIPNVEHLLDIFIFVDTNSVDLCRACYRFLHPAAETMSGRISKVCFPGSGGWMSYSVGLVGPERVTPNKPLILTIHRIYDLSAGQIPEGCDFGGVQTLGPLETPDNRDYPAGYTERRWPCVGCLIQRESESTPPSLHPWTAPPPSLSAGIEIRAVEMVLPQA